MKRNLYAGDKFNTPVCDCRNRIHKAYYYDSLYQTIKFVKYEKHNV